MGSKAGRHGSFQGEEGAAAVLYDWGGAGTRWKRPCSGSWGAVVMLELRARGHVFCLKFGSSDGT